MTDIWMAVAPSSKSTRVIATRGPNEAILKANLRTSPKHHRALPALLEALALWEGTLVRAALVADERSITSGTSIVHNYFAEIDGAPLYTLDMVWDRPRRRRADGLGGMGSFDDLRRVLRDEVAR